MNDHDNRIPRASFFQHEGDFKDTYPTDPVPLDMRDQSEDSDKGRTPLIIVALALVIVSITVAFFGSKG